MEDGWSERNKGWYIFFLKIEKFLLLILMNRRNIDLIINFRRKYFKYICYIVIDIILKIIVYF